MSNERGQYSSRPRPRPRVGADAPSAGWKPNPLLIAGVGLGVLGLAYLATRTSKPEITEQEKEIVAWNAEFPGLPWRMDEVKDSRQLDMWERARDHWERTR